MPRADQRACGRMTALAALEWMAEKIAQYRERGGGDFFLDEDESWLSRWLTWFEAAAHSWAPRSAPRRLGARPAGALTLSVLVDRLATIAEILSGPRERPAWRRRAFYRKFRQRQARDRRSAHCAPAIIPRALALSG